jgi:hypothetical protein
VPGSNVTPEELWVWIRDRTEDVDGRLVCRTPIWGYLESRGVEPDWRRRKLRTALVKELEAQGRVSRPHPQSGWLYVLAE